MKLEDLHLKLQGENEQLIKDLRIKAGMIAMGERIAYGSDSGIMDAAADALEKLTTSTINETLAWVREWAKSEEIREDKPSESINKHLATWRQGYNEALTDLLKLLETKDTN